MLDNIQVLELVNKWIKEHPQVDKAAAIAAREAWPPLCLFKDLYDIFKEVFWREPTDNSPGKVASAFRMKFVNPKGQPDKKWRDAGAVAGEGKLEQYLDMMKQKGVDLKAEAEIKVKKYIPRHENEPEIKPQQIQKIQGGGCNMQLRGKRLLSTPEQSTSAAAAADAKKFKMEEGKSVSQLISDTDWDILLKGKLFEQIDVMAAVRKRQLALDFELLQLRQFKADHEGCQAVASSELLQLRQFKAEHEGCQAFASSKVQRQMNPDLFGTSDSSERKSQDSTVQFLQDSLESLVASPIELASQKGAGAVVPNTPQFNATATKNFADLLEINNPNKVTDIDAAAAATVVSEFLDGKQLHQAAAGNGKEKEKPALSGVIDKDQDENRQTSDLLTPVCREFVKVNGNKSNGGMEEVQFVDDINHKKCPPFIKMEPMEIQTVNIPDEEDGNGDIKPDIGPIFSTKNVIKMENDK